MSINIMLNIKQNKVPTEIELKCLNHVVFYFKNSFLAYKICNYFSQNL